MSGSELTNQAYRTVLENFSEMKDWVGKELGLSEWITITQEDINTFGKMTQDEQWIHVDVARSQKESPYQTTIAHGFYVLSFASRFVYNCFFVEDFVMGVNYGLNKVRFINATPSGARIRGRVSLLEVEEIPNGVKYIVKIVFELEGAEKPACVAEFIAQAYTG